MITHLLNVVTIQIEGRLLSLSSCQGTTAQILDEETDTPTVITYYLLRVVCL